MGYNERDWRQVGVDACNRVAFSGIVLGISGLTTFGFLRMKGGNGMADDKREQAGSGKRTEVEKGAGRRAAPLPESIRAVPDLDFHSGAGRRPSPLPDPRFALPKEAPKPAAAAPAAPPAPPSDK